jgi:hypothetical protein
MCVLFNLSDVGLEHVHLGDGDSLLGTEVLTDLVDTLQVFKFVQICDITRVEDVVDILKLGLCDDLGVDKQEGSVLVLATSIEEACLNIISPVLHAISFDDLNLEQFVVGHEGGEPRQGLSSTTTDTEEQSVSKRLSNNSGNSRHVVDGIQEHDQFHLDFDGSVVFIEELNNFLDHIFDVHNLLVDSLVSVDTVHVVTKDDSLHVEDVGHVQLEGRGTLI